MARRTMDVRCVHAETRHRPGIINVPRPVERHPQPDSSQPAASSRSCVVVMFVGMHCFCSSTGLPHWLPWWFHWLRWFCAMAMGPGFGV